MTNTENARWTTSARTVRNCFDPLSELLRVDAPADEVAALFRRLTEIRGVHRVEITRRPGEVVEGRLVESPWFGVYVTGTNRGVLGAKNLLALSGLQALDRNADHDHAGCIASARAMGVPASWAHAPETYLSM